MNTEQFDDIIVKNRLYKTEKLLGKKAEDYARGDRLSNFKIVAEFLGTTPEKVLLFWFMKHVESLKSFVNDLDEGLNVSLEKWEEKFQDVICYMILLEGLVIERNQILAEKDFKAPTSKEPEKEEEICLYKWIKENGGFEGSCGYVMYQGIIPEKCPKCSKKLNVDIPME